MSRPVEEHLWEEAEAAKELAAALYPFLESVTHSSTEISAVIGELFNLHAALGDLRGWVLHPDYQRNVPYIMDDLSLGLFPLSKALEDVEMLAGRIDLMASRSPAAHEQVWLDMGHVFRTDMTPLCDRFETYKLFLIEVTTRLRGCVIAA